MDLWPAFRSPDAAQYGSPGRRELQEANELFELAMQFIRRQNDLPRGQRAPERALAIEPQFPEALRYHAFGYLIQILNGYTNDISLFIKPSRN